MRYSNQSILIVAVVTTAALILTKPVHAAEQPAIVEITELIVGDIEHYSNLSDSDRARALAVASLKSRCESWRQEVLARADGKTSFIELDCDPAKSLPKIEKFGSGASKIMQASLNAHIKIGPKYGYLLMTDALRGAYVSETQANSTVAALSSYTARCVTWKKNLQAHFSSSFIYASCGKQRLLFNQDVLDFERGRMIPKDSEVPQTMPGSRFSSEGQILILLEDEYSQFESRVGDKERSRYENNSGVIDPNNYNCSGTDLVLCRANLEMRYWQNCGDFKANMANRYQNRLIYASCEHELNTAEIMQIKAPYHYLINRQETRWIIQHEVTGFNAGTNGSVWFIK